MDETAKTLIRGYRKIRRKSLKENSGTLPVKIKSLFSTSVHVDHISDFESKFQPVLSDLINKTLKGKSLEEIKLVRLQVKMINESLSFITNLMTVLTILLVTTTGFFVALEELIGAKEDLVASLLFIGFAIFTLVKRMSLLEHSGICSQLEKFLEAEVDNEN
ncbi:MAG: hypothetical protein WA981_06540 [Glaciecola sp.]